MSISSLQVHKFYSTSHSNCWLTLSLSSFHMPTIILSSLTQLQMRSWARSLVQLKSGFYSPQDRVTQLPRMKPAVSREEESGKWHTNFTTHITEQNAFMQKYLLNTSSVPDTSRFWGDNSEQKTLFVSVSSHSVVGENNKQIPNKHQMYRVFISVVNSDSGVLVNV